MSDYATAPAQDFVPTPAVEPVDDPQFYFGTSPERDFKAASTIPSFAGIEAEWSSNA